MCSLILYGRGSNLFQKWLNLSASEKLVRNVSALSNSFSSASAAVVSPQDSRKGKNFTVSYLVKSLALTTKLAESISRKVSFEDKYNPDSVLKLLRSYGFSDFQISSIITIYPRLLILDAEKFLSIRFKFLQSRGASRSEVAEIVSSVPKILSKKGHKTFSLYYDLVKEIIVTDKSTSKLKKSCLSLPEGSKQENKFRNVTVLRDLGVPQRFLLPLLISKGGPVNGKEKFEESLKKVVEMGFDPTTSKFIDALRILQALSGKKIEEKLEDFKRLGFTVEDVWTMFKKFPMFLGLSEKKIANSIETFEGLGLTRDDYVVMVKQFPSCLNLSSESVKKKSGFLVKEMGWPVQALIPNPQALGLSMEKRIVPRCNVIKALLSKGLIGDEGSELPPMQSVLKTTDEAFLNRYVRKHDDKKLVDELMYIFTRNHAS